MLGKRFLAGCSGGIAADTPDDAERRRGGESVGGSLEGSAGCRTGGEPHLCIASSHRELGCMLRERGMAGCSQRVAGYQRRSEFRARGSEAAGRAVRPGGFRGELGKGPAAHQRRPGGVAGGSRGRTRPRRAHGGGRNGKGAAAFQQSRVSGGQSEGRPAKHAVRVRTGEAHR